MMASKFDPFWEQRLTEILSALDKVAEKQETQTISCSGIEKIGNRQSWNGTVRLLDGRILSGSMAHMVALGKVIAKHTREYPGLRFRFSMNNKQILTIKLDRTEPVHKALKIPTTNEGELSFPNDCSDFHRFAWALPRYHHPVPWNDLPSDGVYLLFERGEQAHGGERIAYVGTHLGEERLPKRLKRHFQGNQSNSIFRKHVGDALQTKFDSPISEAEISAYIRENISFAVIPVQGGKEALQRVEKQIIRMLSSCPMHSASGHWLGSFSPHPVIRSSGGWNIQGTALNQAEVGKQEQASILLLFPCSAAKTLDGKSSFSPLEENSVYSFLQPQAAEKLAHGRQLVEPIAKIEKDKPKRFALDLYNGNMYKTENFRSAIKKFLQQEYCFAAILSGGYGLVLPNEKIHKYDCSMDKSYTKWIKDELPEVISDLAASLKARQVVGFFGKTTFYKKMMCKVKWSHPQLESVSFVYPDTTMPGGFQQKVPKFLGQAIVRFIGSGCDIHALDDFFAEGMRSVIETRLDFPVW